MEPITPNESINRPTSLIEKLGIRIGLVEPQHSEMSMPVSGNTQPNELLHGGATAALCETAASLAAAKHAETLFGARGVAVGTDLSISHVRGVREGLVHATATARHLGRSSTIHAVEVVDDRGKLISTALVTNRVLEPR